MYFITTTDGSKYHLTTNAGLIGSSTLGTFIALNDLSNESNFTNHGASIMEPGSGSEDHLNMVGAAQSLSSPTDGDKWTDLHHTIDFTDVRLDVTQQPTGMNFYYGGNGGIQLTARQTGSVASVIPGWSWYWVSVDSSVIIIIIKVPISSALLTSQSNPFTRINGTITVNNTTKTIDTTESFALFERQWGDFYTPGGYYATWAYLQTGEVLISWIIEPDLHGVGNYSFLSVFHPSGLHEMMPVGPASYASDITRGSVTGRKYFNNVFIDLPARGANLSYTTVVRDAEIAPLLETQRTTYINISESYIEGMAFWNGKEVPFFGHIEHLSRML